MYLPSKALEKWMCKWTAKDSEHRILYVSELIGTVPMRWDIDRRQIRHILKNQVVALFMQVYVQIIIMTDAAGH